MTCKFAYAFCRFRGNACGGDLVAFAFIFGLVVKEFDVLHHHFGDGECGRFSIAASEASAGNLRSRNQAFHHHLVTFLHCLFDGRCQLVGGLYLGHSEARASGIWLDETGKSDAVDDFLIGHTLHAVSYEDAVGNVDFGEGAEEVVQGIFVEGQRLYQHSAGAVWDADDVEVALQYAVFARCTVDGDIGEVEELAFVVAGIAEVVVVDGYPCGSLIIGKVIGRVVWTHDGMHVVSFLFHDVAIVFLFVHEGQDTACTAQAHIVLGAVSSGNDGNLLFHALRQCML